MRLRRTRAGLALGATLTTWIVAACGGTAIVDPADGDGGSGATTTSGAGGTGGISTSATTSTVSSSTGMIDGFCVPACESLKECGGGFDNCIANCEQRRQSACGDLHQAWLSCGLGETSTMCGFGAGVICGPQLEAWLDCSGIVAGELGCAGGPDFCSCSVFVSPGVELVQECSDGGCECLFGGETSLGFCPDPDPGCEPIFNCCAGLFHTGGI